nr:transposase [Baaleninema simplex]
MNLKNGCVKHRVFMVMLSRQFAIILTHLNTICNYFLSRTTNGVMEGINNRLKLIKRQAYGFINFENMRMRFLSCFT